jgi:hypothetical protein
MGLHVVKSDPRSFAPRIRDVMAPVVSLTMHFLGIMLVVNSRASFAWSADDPKAAIDQAIDQLASHNPLPFWKYPEDERSEPTYPPRFDKAAQARALKAWDKLLTQGGQAFPSLIKALADEHYSCTIREDIWKNLDVGGVCYRIVRRQVEVYKPFVRREFDGRVVPSWILKSTGEDDPFKATRIWWGKHKGKTLRELQIEATEWAMDYEVKKGFRDADHRKFYLDRLTEFLKKLKSSDHAIRVDRDGAFVGEDAKLWDGQSGYSPPKKSGDKN